ncbi:MAG: zonular occludens toxin [Inoviridae sp.]|nr:MAG: zonular occludens toxin [Inoviridae sp.]
MPIMLINGANGHGKGQLVVKMILDYQNENDKLEKKGLPRRPIFANVHGINESGVTPLPDVSPIPSDKVFFGKQNNPDSPPPDGFFVPPIGSIFIYDEAQKIEWIKQKAGALSTDERVSSLEEHRHAGLDVIFVTQSTNYIHSHIAGLVSPHYYVERPLGLATTNVFMFNKFQKTPDAVSTRSKADDQFMISLGKKYGQYYKSSEQHNIKRTIPLKLKVMVAVLALCILYTLFNYNKSQSNKVVPPVAESPTALSNEVIAEVDSAHQKMVIDDLTARLAMLERELYEQRLPADYQVTEKNPAIRVSGVVNMGDKGCRAYNAYGEMLNLTVGECDYYLADAGRVQKSHGGSISSVPPSNPSNPVSSSSNNEQMVNPTVNPFS